MSKPTDGAIAAVEHIARLDGTYLARDPASLEAEAQIIDDYAVNPAVAAQHEADAKVCERLADETRSNVRKDVLYIAAAAIRRGEPAEPQGDRA